MTPPTEGTAATPSAPTPDKALLVPVRLPGGGIQWVPVPVMMQAPATPATGTPQVLA